MSYDDTHMLLTYVTQTHGMSRILQECSIAQAREYRKLLDCVECEWDEMNSSSQIEEFISRLSGSPDYLITSLHLSQSNLRQETQSSIAFVSLFMIAKWNESDSIDCLDSLEGILLRFLEFLEPKW